MKYLKFVYFLFLLFKITGASSQSLSYVHPNTQEAGWVDLFNKNLSNAIFPAGIWTVSDGVMTASKDEAIWSAKAYDDFVLDLEFKNAEGTNSGVIVHATDTKDWIPHSVEIQITDDFADEWAKSPANWQCASFFGHQAANKKLVKKPGEWNHYTITCKGKKIWVALNGELVNEFDMNSFTSAKKNPDGTDVPAWLSNPPSTLGLHGHIGFQGKHAGAPIYFRNIRIKELKG
ncbi:MAG: DUF1080 domain-containing protein [Chitinophagales bacterium]